MDKEKLRFCERLRMRMAEILEVPPDDIDMVSIINCCERAVRESLEKDNGEFVIRCENETEEEAFISGLAPKIVERIFAREEPFGLWLDKYEESYIRERME